MPEVSIETDTPSTEPFDFSEAAVVVMKRLPDMGRAMWRALLNGEAGEVNKQHAVVRLQNLFWDMVDGATLGDRSTGLMVEELIKEHDPDYKKHMGLENREGLELELVLGPEPVPVRCCSCNKPAVWVRHTRLVIDHFFCDSHARMSSGFGMQDPSFFTWEELTAKAS